MNKLLQTNQKQIAAFVGGVIGCAIFMTIGFCVRVAILHNHIMDGAFLEPPRGTGQLV